MTIETIVRDGVTVAAVNAGEKVITDVQSALDLIMAVRYDTGTKNIALEKKLITEDFFILSTGLAGEILQKFVNYGVRFAVYGDYSRYTSKPLHDFIYESNKGHDVFFVATKEEAVEKLARA